MPKKENKVGINKKEKKRILYQMVLGRKWKYKRKLYDFPKIIIIAKMLYVKFYKIPLKSNQRKFIA